SATLQGSDRTLDSNVNPSATSPAVLPSGGSDGRIDFGYYKPVTIGDFVWNDVNGNGIQNSGEPGIAGVTLTLTGSTGAGVSVTDHATTSASGAYQFTEAPGTYTVTVDAGNFTGTGVLAGYTAAPTLQGSDRTLDSNVNPSATSPAALPSGGSDGTVDFGYYRATSPSGTGAAIILDDRSSGFSETGSVWGSNTELGYGGEYQYHQSTPGATDTAMWQVTGLAPSTYDAQLTWVGGYGNRPTNTPIWIYD